MKAFLQTTVLFTSLCVASHAREVTLTVNGESSHGATNFSDAVSIGTNEVAEVRSIYGTGAGVTLYVVKNGITNLFGVSGFQWQDEWVNAFSNTNQNRFFRLRAERSLP
jgi:hypothetical protein